MTKKKVHSGGATAFPRVEPRPKYPSGVKIFTADIISKVRSSAIAVAFATSAYPIYLYLHALYNAIPDDARIPYLNIPYDEKLWFTICTSVIHSVLYFGINTSFMLFEKYGIFEEFKLDRKPYQIPKPGKLTKTIIEALINQFVTGPLVLYFLIYDVFKYFGAPAANAPLPGTLELFTYFIGCLYFNDIGFYFSHRLVHWGPMYRYIHKQHHTYIGTIGFAAEYAHPIEQIVSNQLPTIGCCMFFGSHFYIWFVWLSWRLYQTYEAHSGYCFYGTILHKMGMTYSNAAAYHDHHHTHNQGNFGAEWLDWTFGTMDVWVRDGEYEGYINLKNIGKKEA